MSLKAVVWERVKLKNVAEYRKEVGADNAKKYTESQKKRRSLNNSIKYGKQSIYFFSLNYKFLLEHKVLVLITIC